VEVVDAHCTPSGADPTGTFASGHLVLRGRAFNAVLGYTHDSITRYSDSTAGERIDIEGDIVTWPMDKPDTYRACSKIGHVKIMCNMDLATWNPGYEHIAEGSVVKLLIMSRTERMTGGWCVLVSKTLYADTYERIGLIKTGTRSRIEPEMGLRHAFSQLFDSSPVMGYLIV
jgi:hypothetical protein